MTKDKPLRVQAGSPYALRVVIANGTSLWTDLSDFDVRSQIRSGEGSQFPLRGDLTPFLTKSFEGDNIVITLNMTGSQTRVLKSGYCDMLVSDVGSADDKAIRVRIGIIEVLPIVTSAS